MRKIEYISPTSFKQWLDDKEEFFRKYLAEDRPDRFPQTPPMAVGSSFDAYVKSYLHTILFGADSDNRFTFEALFEAQVEAHNRDQARLDGKYCFDAYRFSGALSQIAELLQRSTSAPKFETTIKGPVHHDGAAVVILGKPDLSFDIDGTDIVLDWKVNGFKSKAGPKKYYVNCLDAWRHPDNKLMKDPDPDHAMPFAKPSRSHGNPHPNAVQTLRYGIWTDAAHPFEAIDLTWAYQLCMYSWVIGCPVGKPSLVCIDQLACDAKKNPTQPHIRIAQFRSVLSDKFQIELFKLLHEMWEVVHSDHIFRDTTQEESAAKCAMLAQQAETLRGDGSEFDKMFNDMARSAQGPKF